jgi:alkylmercury lyase
MARQDVRMLEQSWDALFPSFSAKEQRAGSMLLRELARGEPVSGARLAQALGAPVGEAEALLSRSGLSPFVYRGEDGRVVGFLGLSTVPTRHRFTIDGRALWTWCAEDSLFLPQLLGEPAHVESQDPESGVSIRLKVSPEGIDSVEPKGVQVSLLRPDTTELTSARQLLATVCHFIFFFASREAGERWVAARPETVLLSLDEAFAFGRRLNVRLFGSVLTQRRADGA